MSSHAFVEETNAPRLPVRRQLSVPRRRSRRSAGYRLRHFNELEPEPDDQGTRFAPLLRKPLYRADGRTSSELEELFSVTRSTIYRAVVRADGREA